ncbi:F-box domain-containing protein [Artemisia annua]|uniref:F-box domain-containing protein n=1 Tax=Artemisia annua TaxID=35608 RepID=A0A2U1KJB0_ARTAN|nr:F-box domain-containing protein [Artemisia annua]
MKSRMLLSPLKIGSWKKLFLCGKKSLKNLAVELPPETIESEILPRLSATLELPHEIIQESKILPRLLDLNNHDSTTIRSIPFVNEGQEVLLLASLDGLVFVRLLNTSESALWNPLTGAYKKLPNFPNSCPLRSAFGFYFDSYEKDYKIVQVPCFGALKAFIYSQRLNLWKEIQWLENHQRLSNSSWSTPISLGESLYFMGKCHNVTNRQCWIIVFDMKSEKFREIRSPLLNQQYAYYLGSLVVIKAYIYNIMLQTFPSYVTSHFVLVTSLNVDI